MAANTRLASAIQILCVVAYHGDAGTTANVVAKSLKTNPVVVRRMLKCLEQHGLVEIRQGKDGGVKLLRDAQDITLDQIHHAIEPDPDTFSLRPLTNNRCPVGSKMKSLLAPVFGAVSVAVDDALRQSTLAGIMGALG
jgi:DNA-binding IscR family transcriptional regulator